MKAGSRTVAFMVGWGGHGVCEYYLGVPRHQIQEELRWKHGDRTTTGADLTVHSLGDPLRRFLKNSQILRFSH